MTYKFYNIFLFQTKSKQNNVILKMRKYMYKVRFRLSKRARINTNEQLASTSANGIAELFMFVHARLLSLWIRLKTILNMYDLDLLLIDFWINFSLYNCIFYAHLIFKKILGRYTRLYTLVHIKLRDIYSTNILREWKLQIWNKNCRVESLWKCKYLWYIM